MKSVINVQDRDQPDGKVTRSSSKHRAEGEKKMMKGGISEMLCGENDRFSPTGICGWGGRWDYSLFRRGPKWKCKPMYPSVLISSTVTGKSRKDEFLTSKKKKKRGKNWNRGVPERVVKGKP